MKKALIIILCLLVTGGIIFAVINYSKPTSSSGSNTSESNIESKKTEAKAESDAPESTEEDSEEGYDILLSKKEIKVKEGTTESFEITFTNPDETSIREYVHCDDQADIVEVRYTPLDNKKITVEVKGLKKGTTEILISDYEYPNYKEYVKVVVE